MKKINPTEITKKDLDRTRELQIKKARAIYQSRPFVTKVWMAMQGFPLDFIKKNWEEITGHNYE